jgi:hypothetical protein
MQQLLQRKPDVGFCSQWHGGNWPTEMVIRSSSGLAQR